MGNTISADAAGGDSFQTQSQLRKALTDAGIAPRKRLGQHFLIDRNLMMKLVTAAAIAPGDCVLEVGAGTGSLTGLLAERAGAVVAVEIDPSLAQIATDRLGHYPRATVLNVDALERKSAVSGKVLKAVQERRLTIGGSLKLVANLPYDIATPLVVNLLIGRPRFDCFCFTVQREVADRFVARENTADFGPVGIVTQVLGTAHRICSAPPQSFWPRPTVHSTMLKIETRPPGELLVGDPAGFSSLVRSFFQHRRQTIGHIARRLECGDRVLDAISRMRLDARQRPESVAAHRWAELYRLLG